MTLVAGIEWREDSPGSLRAYLHGSKQAIAWAPQPGSQQAFLECPVREALAEGSRGPGKTDAILMSYAQHVGQGYGADWRGIIFRKTFPELRDIIAKSQKWFYEIFPTAKYNISAHEWTFADGEVLIFGHMERPSDYYKYHGHAYPFIGWEELTTFADPTCYKLMFSCNRSTNPDVPRMIRATCNPYGSGHSWVKARFELPIRNGKTIGPIIKTEGEPDRVAIHGTLLENKVLLAADPDYIENLRAAARNPSELAAWIDGAWDIVSGGMFDDVWQPEHQVVPPIPIDIIPKGWRLDRSYDHGQSRPFSVGWWAESSGEPIEHEGRLIGEVAGDTIRLREWYGFSGEPNVGVRMLSTEIAEGILARERDWFGALAKRIHPGAADSAIYAAYEGTRSVAGDMASKGVTWRRADKRPGSRVLGWQQMRKMLKHAIPGEDGYREEPGLFVTSACVQWLRTVPVLSRSDKNPDDANSDAEDHIADETRYRVTTKPPPKPAPIAPGRLIKAS